MLNENVDCLNFLTLSYLVVKKRKIKLKYYKLAKNGEMAEWSKARVC